MNKEIKAADILEPSHPYHPLFVQWLAKRREEIGPDSGHMNRRKARLFLSENHGRLRRMWPSVLAHHERLHQEKEAARRAA